MRRKLIGIVIAGTVSAAIAATGAQAATGGRAVTSRPGAVIVRDILIPVAGQPSVPAYVVRPAGALAPHSEAGILWLHWLGQIHSDRTEFLPEAVQLASHGVVSVLPEGTFPWQAAPVGTSADVTAVENQLAAFRTCLDRLTTRRSIDPSRIAIVGHDYGAMYGALLADEDPQVSAAVLATPDATWGHWFVKYWLGYTGGQAKSYEALFDGLQPVEHVSRLGARELFQWAGKDIYVSAGVRQRFAAAAPQAKVDLYPDADHQLTDAAIADRDAFLEQVLALP
ncbi:MAG TPA: dienelactone hydrolase family protein [Solirubrobacteraceae bacterium]|nr:dienelactone hydrolase family protein [Solirubrobacteraceae bacterium]